MMERFHGTVTTQTQLLDANQLQKLCLTLQRPTLAGVDISNRAPPPGTPIPPAYHLVYFTPNGLESQLGADGTDRTYNAPSPFTRRMWAGGTMQWQGGLELRVGDEVTEETRLLSATAKKGKGGEMVLVEVEKRFSTARGVGLTDRRSWIFRPDIAHGLGNTGAGLNMNANGRESLHKPTLIEDDGGNPLTRRFRWSPVGLFRFSALTFNGHKIHYDDGWAQNVEGHPGLVVHGPLNLINMIDYWRDTHAAEGALPSEINYRAVAPIYAGEEYEITRDGQPGSWEDGKTRILVNKQGGVCMKGDVLG